MEILLLRLSGYAFLRSTLVSICVLFALFLGFSQAAIATPLKLVDNVRSVWTDKSGLDGEFTFVVIGDTRSNTKYSLHFSTR